MTGAIALPYTTSVWRTCLLGGACLLLVSLFVLLYRYFLLGLFKHSTEARWTRCFGCCEEEALLGESRAYWDTKKAKNSVVQSRGGGITLSTSDQLEAKEGKTAGHAENPPTRSVGSTSVSGDASGSREGRELQYARTQKPEKTVFVW